MPEVYYRIKEVAALLGYSERCIQRYCKLKQIACVNIHNSYRIPKKWVDQNLDKIREFIEANKLEPETPLEPVIEDKPAFNESKPASVEPVNIATEVKEDMSKKKTDSNTTEITTNKPKVKEFTPKPEKRTKRIVKPEFESKYNNQSDYSLDDSSHDSDREDILTGYKGIGNYDF